MTVFEAWIWLNKCGFNKTEIGTP